jgi:hypothetical protein
MAALCLGKSPRYPLIRRLGGLQSQSICCEEEIDLLALQDLNSGSSRL